jgi:hypothetical protein
MGSSKPHGYGHPHCSWANSNDYQCVLCTATICHCAGIGLVTPGLGLNSSIRGGVWSFSGSDRGDQEDADRVSRVEHNLRSSQAPLEEVRKKLAEYGV